MPNDTEHDRRDTDADREGRRGEDHEPEDALFRHTTDDPVPGLAVGV